MSSRRAAKQFFMRAIVTTRNGDVGALKIQERPDPVPSNGQVLVRVKAAGLNFADILARQGLYPDGPPKPCVMGYEVSGTIEAVGDGDDRNLIGTLLVNELLTAAFSRPKGERPPYYLFIDEDRKSVV